MKKVFTILMGTALLVSGYICGRYQNGHSQDSGNAGGYNASNVLPIDTLKDMFRIVKSSLTANQYYLYVTKYAGDGITPSSLMGLNMKYEVSIIEKEKEFEFKTSGTFLDQTKLMKQITYTLQPNTIVFSNGIISGSDLASSSTVSFGLNDVVNVGNDGSGNVVFGLVDLETITARQAR